MRPPISIADFSFIPQRKDVTIYFRGVAVYEFSASLLTACVADETIAKLVQEYNTDYRYVVACRFIREVQEQIKFPATYPDFDAYVKDWPEAEHFRTWVTNRGRCPAKFLQITGHWNGLPGGYCWISIREYNVGKDKPFEYAVGVNDNDDGSCTKDMPSKEAAEKELEATLKLAPTNMHELCELAGFKFD